MEPAGLQVCAYTRVWWASRKHCFLILGVSEISGHDAGDLVPLLGQYYSVAIQCVLSQFGAHPDMT